MDLVPLVLVITSREKEGWIRLLTTEQFAHPDGGFRTEHTGTT